MYTFLIDDMANIMETRGATRAKLDEILAGIVPQDPETFGLDDRAIEAAAQKDAMFGGASYE